MQCGGAGASYVGERYRVVDHVMKHHMALDQTPFYCKLCMFRCTTLDQLDRHVTSYKRHVTMAAMPEYQGDASRYLVRNSNARPIKEGIDFRPLTEEEHQQFRPTENMASTSTPSQSNPEELVTVKLPPSVLASLLSSTGTNLKAQTPLAPPVNQYDPARPSLTEPVDTDFMDEIFGTASNCTATGKPNTHPQPNVRSQSLRYEPTPILSTSPQLRIPDFPAARSGSHTPAVSNRSAFSPLMTPELPNCTEENIMPQLLGEQSSENMIFPPLPAQSAAKQPEPVKKMVDQETQTLPQNTQKEDSLAPLNAVLGHFEKTMEVALGKVTFAVESVARATRHFQQSLDAMGTSLTQISRAVDRLTDEQRRQARNRETTSSQSTNKRAREDEDKENDRALKSVVTKKSNTHRR